MSSAVDLFMVYQFIKRLSSSYKEWPAYKAGVIDEKGNILKSKRERRLDVESRKSFTKFDLLVLKIKNLLGNVPGGQRRLANYAAALWFIKEQNENYTEVLTETKLNEYMSLVETTQLNRDFEQLFEEPTMSAGGGQVASIGIGPDGEPGFTKSAMKKYKNKNRDKILKRWGYNG